jgi:hypothetical protein
MTIEFSQNLLYRSYPKITLAIKIHLNIGQKLQTLKIRGSHIFQKSRSLLKTTDTGRVKWNKSQTKYPQILSATVQNIVYPANWRPRFVYPCFRWTPICISKRTWSDSRYLSERKVFETKVVEENWNTHFKYQPPPPPTEKNLSRPFITRHITTACKFVCSLFLCVVSKSAHFVSSPLWRNTRRSHTLTAPPFIFPPWHLCFLYITIKANNWISH